MDIRPSHSIHFRVTPHEPIKQLFLEADLGIRQILQLVDELFRNHQPLIVACLYDIRRILMLDRDVSQPVQSWGRLLNLCISLLQKLLSMFKKLRFGGLTAQT